MADWKKIFSPRSILKFFLALSATALILVYIDTTGANNLPSSGDIIKVVHANSSTYHHINVSSHKIPASPSSSSNDVYSYRHNFVRQFCEDPHHPVAKVSSPQDIIDMSQELGVYWCPVFKCGSSQWLKLFCSARDVKHLSASEKRLVKSRSGICNINTLRSHGEVCYPPRQDCVNKGASVFMVVRNPIWRFLSAFSNKWELANVNWFWQNSGSKIVSRFRRVNRTEFPHAEKLLQEASQIITARELELKKISNIVRRNTNYTLSPSQWALIRNSSNPYLNPPGPTLTELIKWALSGGTNVHITPFYQYCAPCTLPYTILKLDHYPNDADFLLHKIGHLELEVPLHEQFQRSAAPWKSDACVTRYLKSVPRQDLEEIFVKMWQVDCQLYQYPCRELVDKVGELMDKVGELVDKVDEEFVIC